MDINKECFNFSVTFNINTFNLGIGSFYKAISFFFFFLFNYCFICIFVWYSKLFSVHAALLYSKTYFVLGMDILFSGDNAYFNINRKACRICRYALTESSNIDRVEVKMSQIFSRVLSILFMLSKKLCLNSCM